MTRRDFLPAVAAPFLPERPPMEPVTDTHQHLWGLPDYHVHWVKPGHSLAGTFGPPEYAAATAGLGVTKSVYMEVDVLPDQQQAEADYVVKLCQGGATPMAAAVVGGHPDSPTFAGYVKQFRGSKWVKGVRRVLHADTTPAGFGLRPEFLAGLRLLGDLGLSFDLCARWPELPDMANIAKACPDTRFILDHCGNPSASFSQAEWDRWRKGLDAVAACPNVVACKVSGFIVNAGGKGPWRAEQLAPAVDGVRAAFGPDRWMFGGDWPVVTLATSYRDWLTVLREIVAGRPAAERQSLFHGTAGRVYGV